MKKTAILSILLCLCMVATLLTGIPASAAIINLDSYADIPTHIEPNENGNNIYFFTMAEAGTLTVTGNTSFELASRDDDSKYGFAEYDQGGTVSLEVVAGERMKLTYGYNDKAIDLSVSFEAAGALKITIGDKSFSAPAGKWLYNTYVDGDVNGEENDAYMYNVLVFDKNYAGEAFATNSHGCALVLDTDNTLIKIYDGANGQYWTAEGKAASIHFTTANYATVAWNELEDGQMLLIFPNDGGSNTARAWALGLRNAPNGPCECGKVATVEGLPEEQPSEGDQPDNEVLDGTYEAQFWGTAMYELVFNNGTLTVKSVTNVANDVSGTYAYIVSGDIPYADCGVFSKDTAGNLTFQPTGFVSALTLVKISDEVGGDVGGDEPSDEPAGLDGVYEAQFYGTAMYKLTFNNGTLTVQSVANVANDVSGTYTYTVVDGLPVADCGLFSKDMGGNLTFQPTGFAMPMTMVRTGDVPDGGDEPVNPPATTEPITVWGPYDMNENYSNGSIAAGQTQEYLIYQMMNGTLEITGSNLTVVYNGVTYTTSRWNNTISISVSEEDMTNLDEWEIGYAALSVSSTQGANYTVKFVFPLGSGENPEKLNNLLKVPTTLLSDGSYYYTWTADFTGELTLYLNQGIEGAVVDVIIHNEDYSNVANLVSYGDDDNMVVAESLTIEVEEGATYTINVQEYADEDGNLKGGNIIFSNREELTATGTADDPFTLEEGEMDLIMEAGKSSDGLFYTYTATGNGILTVTVQNWVDGCKLLIVGMNNQGNGVYTLEVEAGKTYNGINPWMTNNAECDLDLTVVFTDESEIEYELGTEQNPEEIDSIDGFVFNANNSDYYYKWTATEDGTLVITLNTTWAYGYNLMVNGENLYGNGTEMEIEVKEGDEIVLVNTVYASADSSGNITLSAEYDNGQAGGDVPSAGDFTFVVFALMALSMTALVVLVSKKRAF